MHLQHTAKGAEQSRLHELNIVHGILHLAQRKQLQSREAFLVDILSAVSQFLSLDGEQVHKVFE